MIKINIGDSNDPLQVASEAARLIQEYNIDSLPEYTSPTRLTPVTLIDKGVTMLDEAVQKDILQTMLSIFAAHYLQAVAISINVNGVNTISLLDQFATDRRNKVDPTDWMEATKAVGLNSISTDLPTFGFENDTKELNQHVNLAIGRLLHVNIGTDDKSTKIPITLTMSPKVIPSNALPSVLAMTNTDTGFISRYHQWRAGEIESFISFALALDLIENDRKAMINDPNDIYTDANRRKANSMLTWFTSRGRKSFNTASTMAVITKSTAEELELALKGKLRSSRTRQEYFKDTHSMMLVVVDPRMERLTIYQRGIDHAGQYTFSDIQEHGSKSGAMDIGSILKAYKLGESPSL